MATEAAPAAAKAKRIPANPYTITPETINSFANGKTTTVEGWRIKLATERGTKAKSVLISEPNLTRELLESVVASMTPTEATA